MKWPGLFVTMMLAVSCSENPASVSDNFRLRHRGADMPVWIRGNTGSGKMLVYLHGGPGECSYCLSDYFQELEEEIAVVYWDQRVAGSSAGNADETTMTYRQFAEDLEMLVRLLGERYPDAGIYLLGHSFGVELAWQFLTTGNNQDLVEGFIVLNGTYSTYDWLVEVQEWILEQAALQEDDEARDYILAHPVTEESIRDIDWGGWYQRMFRLGANPVWPSDDPGYDFNLWFFSPHSRFSQMTNTGRYDHYYSEEIFNFNRKEHLGSITIPVKLLWGMKDGIMPHGVAERTLSLLTGTSPSLVPFEESWHTPFHTENQKFTGEVIDFLFED